MNVGAAAIDITPGFEVELSGFAARAHPCAGVLDPIFARAIYLDDGNEKFLWIACDLIALERSFIEPLREWVRRELNLAAHQLLLSCTHTHSAPATIHLNAAGRYSERYIQFLREKLEQLSRDALRDPQPCDVLSGHATLDLAIDRRDKPSAHVDNIVSAVAWASRADGRHVAAIGNYAMHPVALGYVNRKISPDWCGAAATEMSSRLPGHPVALISNGAAGNLNPPAENVSREHAAEYGRQVAGAALAALVAAKAQSAARLRVRSVTVAVQLDVLDDAGIDRAADEFLAHIGPEHHWRRVIHDAVETWRSAMKRTIAAVGGREVEIELQAIRLGEATIVAVNGEMFSHFTALLRERLDMENLFVVAYANSAFGYIPTRAAYAEGGYEVEQAHFFYNSFRPKIGSLEMLVDRAAELIYSLSPPAGRG